MVTMKRAPLCAAYSYCSVTEGDPDGTTSARMPAAQSSAHKPSRSGSNPPLPRAHTNTSVAAAVVVGDAPPPSPPVAPPPKV